LKRVVTTIKQSLAISGLGLLCACQGTDTSRAVNTSPPASTANTVIAAVPLGDVAGTAKYSPDSPVRNPYGRDANAAQQGKQLFIEMNCAGCHGYDAKGGMGPNLTDKYWRYGGVPVAIFKSIYEGRPQGMPAWNPALPPGEIWKLVAYIQSLGGTFAPEQYQASIQGDHPGDRVAAEVPPTLKGSAAKPAPAEKSSGSTPPSVEPQPDTVGTPAGSKP
jgi:cytochrome c oxidase cbb3-type subunit 3